MTRDEIIIWFQENYTDLFYEMQKSDHNLDKNNRNKFHSEGSVWTHTMMVMTVADFRYMYYNNKKVLLIAGLLHDIGKPLAQELVEKDGNKKYRFKGHEGLSTFMSISILNHMLKDKIISEKERLLIIKVVALHGTNTEQYQDTSFGELINKFRFCDKNGAIRNVDENIYSQYDKRKSTHNHDPESERTGIILCGLPCSGKSTYYEQLPYNIKRVSRDEFMYWFLFVHKMYVKTHLNSNYNDVYKTIHEDKNLLNEFNRKFDGHLQSMSKYNHLIVDMTMLSSSSRRKMMNKLGKRNWKCVVFLPSIEKIKERNKERSTVDKTISDTVYMNMMKSFILPHEIEGFSSIEYKF